MPPSSVGLKGLLVSCLTVSMSWFSGCASMALAPELLQAKQAREAAFAENLDRYPARTGEEREILRLLKDNYKKGVETFDLSLLRTILAPDFEARHYWSKDRVVVQTLDAFLAERASWAPRHDPDRRLLISVQEVKSDEARARYAVATLTTHKSKYFAPRFAEMFVFEKIADKWLLRRQFVFPAYPPHPKLNEVRIFVGDWKKQYTSDTVREMIARGPDVVIDDYLLEFGGWRTDGVRRPAIVVFRESVLPGSRVIIRDGPYESRIAALPGVAYFYAVMDGWWFRGGGQCVPFTIEVDGAVVHEQLICTQ